MSDSRNIPGEFISLAPASIHDRRSDSPSPAASMCEPVAIDRRRRLFSALRVLPASVLLLLIRIYQRTLSPALPILTMGRCGCRFSPTCSHYAAEAIHRHGALRGAALAAIRLVKCTPLHPGGFDPVPTRLASRERVRPVCLRARPDAG